MFGEYHGAMTSAIISSRGWTLSTVGITNPAMYRQHRIAVVIPAFNERRAIAATVAAVPDFVDDVLVIDDASTDDTAAQVALRSGLEVIVHAHNRGVGGAIATGYRRTLELGADIAVVMAGDGQMDPVDLPALLDPIAARRADYVKGNRFLHPAIWSTMPPARILGNALLSAASTRTPGGGSG